MKALEYIVRKAEDLGASQVEAFYSKKTELEIRAEKKEVKIGQLIFDIGVGIRLALKRNGGYSLAFTYSADFSKKALDEAIEQALKICRVRKPDADFKSFPEKNSVESIYNIYDKKISEFPSEEAIDLVNHQIEVASADKRVETVRGLTTLTVNEVSIMNSLGVSGSYEASCFFTSIYVLAKEANSQGVGWEDYGSCFYNADESFEVAQKAMDLALQQLHAKSIKGMKMNIIISPDALAKLLMYTLIQQLRADRVQKLQSPLVGKLNQEITSEALTIISDGRIQNAPGSKPFDDEGAPTTKTTLVEKGVLKNFLYDTYSARKEETTSTGNALRHALLQIVPKYRLEPSISLTNLIIEPGTASVDDMIKEVKNGIITKDFIGAHTSNSQSGAFSIAPYGAFKIEKGEIKYPIKEVMIGGEILTLLNNIEVIGNDVKQVLLYDAALIKDATLIAPSMLVKDVAVSA